MKQMKVKITFTESILGTCSADPEVHRTYIASKAEDAVKIEEEVEALGVDAVEEKQMTVFARTEDDQPMLWDYQIKGFFKGACGFLRKVAGTESSKCKAYKKEIDGLIFVEERRIPIDFDGEITTCQRPLRAQTMQGERVALANSEEIPAGASIIFTVTCMVDSDMKMVEEWLNYGKYTGIGQWRNASHGRFTWERC